MDRTQSIQEIEKEVREYQDFLSQSELDEILILLDQFRGIESGISMSSQMTEEGAPLGGNEEEDGLQKEREILERIQVIIDES